MTLLVLGLVAGSGGVVVVHNPFEPPFSLFFLPWLGVWLSARTSREDLVDGGAELLVSRGVPVATLLAVRLGISLLLAGGAAVASLVPVVQTGALSWSEAVSHTLVVVYWCVLGLSLGTLLSAPASVLLAVALSLAALWWAMAGCFVITGQLPTGSPWNVITATIMLAGGSVPLTAVRQTHHVPAGVEWIRMLPAMALLAWTWRRAVRWHFAGTRGAS
jgi:hypothetical protein